jgi:hypothetical protein
LREHEERRDRSSNPREDRGDRFTSGTGEGGLPNTSSGEGVMMVGRAMKYPPGGQVL